MSVLLLFDVSTALLDACDFSIVLAVRIFVCPKIGEVMDFPTTLGFVLPFFSRANSPIFDNHVNSIDHQLFDIIQILTCFYNPFTWIIRFIRQWDNGIV